MHGTTCCMHGRPESPNELVCILNCNLQTLSTPWKMGMCTGMFFEVRMCYRVVNSWDPVGAPAPSAQITPESSPCKSQRSQCSPIPPSVSCTVSPKQGGRTPPTSRSARRLDAMLQQKLLDSLQGTYLPEVNPKEDQCCESLPSRLGFVTDDAVHHVDSPAHMLPGPEEVMMGTPAPNEQHLVCIRPLLIQKSYDARRLLHSHTVCSWQGLRSS